MPRNDETRHVPVVYTTGTKRVSGSNRISAVPPSLRRPTFGPHATRPLCNGSSRRSLLGRCVAPFGPGLRGDIRHRSVARGLALSPLAGGSQPAYSSPSTPRGSWSRSARVTRATRPRQADPAIPPSNPVLAHQCDVQGAGAPWLRTASRPAHRVQRRSPRHRSRSRRAPYAARLRRGRRSQRT